MEQFEEFNKACDEVEDRDFNLATENVIEFLRGSKVATVTFTQGRYITKIKKLAEKYPDKVQIVAENKDGSIVAHIPVSAIKINIIEGRELTEEEKKIARERLRSYRESRQDA
jgi:predicted N-acetyltransferase YhbS